MRTRSATTAASRYGGRCARWAGSGCRLSHTLAALEMSDGTGEQVAHLLWNEMAVQQAVARDGDGRGLFRHDQDRRIGFLRQSQRRPMARAERLVGHLELRQRQHAARADDLIAPNQYRAVVERGVWRENRGQQIGGDLRFHRHAGGDELLEADVALDRDDRAGAGAW